MYSKDELEMMGEGGEDVGCRGETVFINGEFVDGVDASFWDSRRMNMGNMTPAIKQAMVQKILASRASSPSSSGCDCQVKALKGPLAGRVLQLSSITKQTTASGEAFVGEGLQGSVFVSGEGEVYGVDNMGFLKKAWRGVKKGAKGAARGVAKGAGAVAKHTGKYAAKGALLATAPIRQAYQGSAWLAFAPIRFVTNQIINGIVNGLRRKGQPADYNKGKALLYAQMSKSSNPILRGGVALLKEYGPGTSPRVKLMGDDVGAAPAAGVAALKAALIAAKPMLTKAAIAYATNQAKGYAARAFGPGESAPQPEPMNVTPSDAQVDNALDAQPTAESSGWEAGCCSVFMQEGSMLLSEFMGQLPKRGRHELSKGWTVAFKMDSEQYEAMIGYDFGR